MTWTDQPAFTTGPLASDPMARFFKAPEGDASWPRDVTLLGPTSLPRPGGKTLLVTLWAEWCAPCLAEMPSLARLNETYRSSAFEILPIATGSHTMKTYADARRRLAAVAGARIGSLIDGSADGEALMQLLAQTRSPPALVLPPGARLGNATALPCALVVDPAGRLRGRLIGGPSASGHSLWETLGEAFVQRLANGV